MLGWAFASRCGYRGHDVREPHGVEHRVARPSKPLSAFKLLLGRGRPRSMKHDQAVPSQRLHSCLAVPPKSHTVAIFWHHCANPADPFIAVVHPERFPYTRGPSDFVITEENRT